QALNKVTELPQTSESIPNVAYKVVYEEWDDRVEKAATIAASLDVEQASGNINRTQSTAMPNVPLPQGIGAGGSPRCQEAMKGFIAQTRFERGKVTPTQVSTQREAHNQEYQPEDQLGVLSAAKVLADVARKNVQTYTRRRRAVSTGSGRISTASRLFSTAKELVSTAGASMPVSTAGMAQRVNISIPSLVVVKDKGKGKMEEYEDEQTKRTKLKQ
nr:hypothetical protein [Tanacetum cinerariifolium]